jgi:chromosome segregation ATPase
MGGSIMALEVPQLRKSLLGYQRSAVDRLIMEFEDLFVASVRENSDVSTRLSETSEELAKALADLAELQEEVDAGRVRAADLEAQLDVSRAGMADLEVVRDELERRVEEREALARSSEGRERVLQAELDAQRTMTSILTERATRAETLASERGDLIAELQRRVDQGDAQTADDVPTRADGNPVPPSRDDVVAAFDVAERAMDRIVHEHRRRASEELETLERRRDAVRREMERLQDRMQRMRTAGSRVRGAAAQASVRIDGVDEAIRAALEPLVGSLSELREGIAELVEPSVVDVSASGGGTDEDAITLGPSSEGEDLSAIETDLLCWLPATERRP